MLKQKTELNIIKTVENLKGLLIGYEKQIFLP